MPGERRYSLGQLLLCTTLTASLLGTAKSLFNPAPGQFHLLLAGLLGVVSIALMFAFLKSWERTFWWTSILAELLATVIFHRSRGEPAVPGKISILTQGLCGATIVSITALASWLLLLIVVRTRPFRNPRLPAPPPARPAGRRAHRFRKALTWPDSDRPNPSLDKGLIHIANDNHSHLV